MTTPRKATRRMFRPARLALSAAAVLALALPLAACGGTGSPGTPRCSTTSHTEYGDWVPAGRRPCVLPVSPTPSRSTTAYRRGYAPAPTPASGRRSSKSSRPKTSTRKSSTKTSGSKPSRLSKSSSSGSKRR
jgi:hypothetical protein